MHTKYIINFCIFQEAEKEIWRDYIFIRYNNTIIIALVMGNKKRITISESELKKIIENQVRRIVCESGHLYGHDSDGNVFTNSEEAYRGVEGSRFISHGEWSDPEIWYNGKSANANDVEDMMREYYKDECEERGIVPSDEEFDNLPAEWFKEHLDEYFSEM